MRKSSFGANLGERWERNFSDGSSGSSIDIGEAEELCRKILDLERQLEERIPMPSPPNR